MADIAERSQEMSLAGIAYQIAALLHDVLFTIPADAAERLLRIGAALWLKSIAVDGKT